MNDKKELKPILLVEDEAVMRESVRDWLTDVGYKVETAEDGEQAIKSIAGQEYGLIILDLRLPGKDGLEVLKEARMKQPKLKGIVITAYPSVETAVEAIKRGAVDYLPKPFDLNRLEAIISDTLGPVQLQIKPEVAGEKKAAPAKVKPAEITLTINDKEVKAAPGTTILQAARNAGIDIPTLCYQEHLSPYGGCRICTVEIIRNGRSRLVTSCVYPVEEGLKVLTESEPVVKVRRMLLEMMWSRAPGAKAVKDLGLKYGIDMDRFDTEASYCILCGLCVRYCHEIKKKNIIGFTGRGTNREVMFQPDADFNECLACGECYKLCPTGVMPSNYGLAKLPK
jgi:bidirectional [NiFe] hydrogenase diaphorase subunit